MHFKVKEIFLLTALSLAIGFFGCAKEEKKVEAPKHEEIAKNLVPPNVEVKSQSFIIKLSDLQVVGKQDITSKEIIETPRLKGSIKITNKTKNILDVQAVTLEYFDEAGKSIDFKSGENISKVTLFLKELRPEGNIEGSLYATIPIKAVKEKTLGKIEINLVYTPIPLKREIVTFSGKIE